MIVKQGYCKIESKGAFSKWKRRWIILLNSETLHGKEILICKNEKSAKDSKSSKKIALESIENVCIIEHSHDRHLVELTFRDGVVKRLLFPLQSIAKEWQEQLNIVCFDSSPDKKLEETLDENTTNTGVCQEPINEEVLDSDSESFPAYLQPSAKLNISGECSLKVTSENIVAYDESSSNSLLVSWPIRALRRFGFDASRFTFEAGRRCDTGEGIFVFKTTHGEKIHNIVQSRAQLLAHDTSHLSTANEADDNANEADDNGNEEFEFRPLPPLPLE